MTKDQLILYLSTVNRALGIIEGVMLVSEPKAEAALATAVSMIDEAINEVMKDVK